MSYIDELIELIKEDKKKINTYDRYPIRFLFTRLSKDSYSDIAELYEKYYKLSMIEGSEFNQLEIVKLSSLLTFDDAWITRQRLYDFIKSLDSNKDYLILGFSELARFYSKSDLQSLIMSFMTDIECELRLKKQRIYFVCFSLYDKLEEILKINGRNANINPVICHPEFVNADSICVYYANSNFVNLSIYKNLIKKTSEWLSLFEIKNIDFGQGIVCLSDTLVSIYEKAKPDNFVEIYKIDSYFSLLTRMYGMSLNNDDTTKFDDVFWKQVYDLSVKYSTVSLKNILFNFFGIKNLDCNNFIDIFIKANIFGKKLISLYLDEYENNLKYSYYLKEVLNKSIDNNFSSFISDIVLYINNLFDNTMFDARKFYINKLFESKIIDREYMQDNLLEIFNSCFNSFLSTKIFTSKLEEENLIKISRKTFTIKYHQSSNYTDDILKCFFEKFLSNAIVGKFQNEQYIIMNFLSNSFINVKDAISIYPDLRLYLGNPINEYINSSKYWLSEYIYEYRLSKILSNGTDKFKSLSCSNTEEKMYKWYSDSALCHQQDIINLNKYDKLYVIDGVGIEYFDFIINFIKCNGKFINYANYSKCYLPSITSVNKEYISNPDKWIIDFDRNCIHGYVYSYVKSLPDSLEYLKSILSKILSDNPTASICITADHGCTCQSKLIETNKKYDFNTADHEGRCMEIGGTSKDIAKSDDYCIFSDMKSGKKYLVSLNNTSLCDKPLREAHGGATLEECFVPCIIFSNNKDIKNYNIRSIKNLINGLDRKILIEINPKVIIPPVFIEESGNQDVFSFEEGNTWSAIVSSVVSQRIKIIIGDFISYIDVISSSGISKRGDDGFDD